jgi:hypothetical protein
MVLECDPLLHISIINEIIFLNDYPIYNVRSSTLHCLCYAVVFDLLIMVL